MANINKELNDIKSATFGREVRGSIHDGIKKINEESEESKGKANEAHEVMESIMSEGFDNAALENNFAQKLDSEIANLQPEWTQFKDNTNEKLADTETNIEDAFNGKSIFKKSIYLKFPVKFEDYDSLIIQEHLTSLYPQSFTIDWDNKEIFILYMPFNGSDKRWIVVYCIETNEYRGCFSAGYAGGAGIVVKKEGMSRYLYVNSIDGKIGKYSIDELPPNKNVLIPEEEYDVNLNWVFNHDGEKWIVAQKEYEGMDVLSVLAFYDDDFNLLGFSRTDNVNVGSFNDRIPKYQALSSANGKLFLSMGAQYKRTYLQSPRYYQGIRILTQGGKLLDEGLIDPNDFINILESNGHSCDIIENEGIHTSPDGSIFSLSVTHAPSHNQSEEYGIIIFKEFSNDKHALDFSKASRVYPNYSPETLANNFPSLNKKMYHPIKGVELDTLESICNMMLELRLPKISFYSSSFNTITDINGLPLPTANQITIHLIKNYTFRCEYNGFPAIRTFGIYKKGEEVRQEEYHVGVGTGMYYEMKDFNGNKLDTVDKICDFLINNKLPKISFYTSTHPTVDLDGKNIDNATFVTMYNVNNATIRARHVGPNYERWFNIIGTTGNRTQTRISDSRP